MFETGEVVQLKSGGPLMTVYEVTNLDGRDMVYWRWFAATEEKSSSFPAEMLKLANAAGQQRGAHRKR